MYITVRSLARNVRRKLWSYSKDFNLFYYIKGGIIMDEFYYSYEKDKYKLNDHINAINNKSLMK